MRISASVTSPTTHRVSNPMRKSLFLLVFCGALFTSCVRIPKDLMRPSAESLKVRELQSHTYETRSDKELLRASMSVLQDMGYTIKESSADYGVLTAEKEASAVCVGQVMGAVAYALLCGENMPIDKTQYITVSIVIVGKNEIDQAVARTTFQRVVEKTDKTIYATPVTDPACYQELYEKIDRALFFEVHQI